MILSDKEDRIDKDGMCDSMSMSATFLDLLDNFIKPIRRSI